MTWHLRGQNASREQENKRDKAGAEYLLFIYIFAMYTLCFRKCRISLATAAGSGVGMRGSSSQAQFFLKCASQYFLVKNSFWFYSSYHTFSQRPSLLPNKLSVLAANHLILLKQVPLFLLTQAT